MKRDTELFRVMVFRLALGCTGNRFDADDITQEAFLRLFLHKKSFTDDEHKKAFLIKITVNLSKDLLKSAWLKKRAALDENIPTDSGFNENEIVLREYILQLKPKYRAVIHLFYYEGFSAAETAKILNISESSVTTRLNRARKQLKGKLINDREVIYE